MIEPEGPNAYLTKTPEELFASGQVAEKPWIFGQTTQEGHFETYSKLTLNTKRLNV